MGNFVFYDTETSGLNKFFGQIFQFAAILTDETFRTLDQFEIRSRRMPHIVPDPSAMLVTNLTPQQLESAEHSYYEFASRIRDKMLEWSPAVFSGYNIFNFDEPFMRSMYYQNLYQPYLSQTNGNKRVDVLPLVRASEFLFPGCLEFPKNDNGKTSKRLEDIAPINGFNNHNAHDAMGDVLATIHIAECIKNKAPLLWEKGLNASSRAGFNGELEGEDWFFAHDHNNGWPLTYPAVELCKIDDGRNSLFYDLRYPLNDVPGNKPEANFKGRNRPFRKIKCAEMPLIFKKDELNEIEIGGSYNFDQLDELASDVRGNPTVLDAALFYDEVQPDFEKSPHIEAQIYDDFDAFKRDQYFMEDFHLARPEEKLGIVRQMSDERFRSFAHRIIYENFPEQMNEGKAEEFQRRIHDRINESDDVPWTTLDQAISECDNLFATVGEKNATVSMIQKYLQQLRTR